MATDKTVNELIINKLTQAQFDAIPEAERSDTELYFITDAEISGGNNEIKWAHVYDIPDDNTTWFGDLYMSFKVDTLPDGNYEFYFYSTRYYEDRNLLLPTTWKVSFSIKTDEYRHVQGFISPILDGDFSFLFNSFTTYSQGITYYHTSDGDLLIPDPFFACKVATSLIIKGIAKCTDIVNVDTNQIYPTTLLIDYNCPYFDNQIGYIELGTLVEQQTIPSNTLFNIRDLNNDGLCLYGVGKLSESEGGNYGCLGGVITIESVDFNNPGEFEAEIYVNKSGVTYKVIKASGILQHIELGTSISQYHVNTWLKPNFENNQTYSCKFYTSRFGAVNDTLFYYFYPNIDDVYVPYDTKLNVGSTITPLNYNKIIQYTGESTDSYINGYFYKACGDVIEIPESCEINQLNYTTSFVLSFAEGKNQDFISWFKKYLNTSSLTADDFSREFTYRRTASGTVSICYPSAYNNIADDELISYFVVDNKVGKSNYNIKFKIINYTPASQEIENGRWEQVNVQPASEGGLTKEEANETYLPLSGGTITGAIDYEVPGSLAQLYPVFSATIGLPSSSLQKTTTISVGGGVDGLYFSGPVNTPGILASSSNGYLGNSTTKWNRLWVKNISNGADIAVPTVGGTLARLEDIPEGTQLETLPTASADNLNKIYQYTGETTSNYVNGHFYKCVEDNVTNLTMMNSFMNGASATLDQEKFLAQNPVFADPSMSNTPFPAWRADYQGDGTWNVWTQTPNLTIDPTELADVWGITISGELQEYDMIAVMKQEEMGYAWKEVVLGNSTADIPAHPTTPGAYTLMCYVDENGSASYAWENVA